MKDVREKIVSLARLAEITGEFRAMGKHIAHCHGVFDQLHLGHMRHFEEASRQADFLVVTLTPDRFVDKGAGRPYWNEILRAEAVANQVTVDYVAINDEKTAVSAIKKLLGPGDFYCKGEEFAGGKDDVTKIGAIFEEEKAAEEVGASLYCTPTGLADISSSAILNAYFPVYPDETRNFLGAFCEEHPTEGILEILEQVAKLKILFIGESLFEEYVYVGPLGTALKDSIVSTRISKMERFAGGITTSANLAAEFCRQIALISVVGPDDIDYGWLVRQLKTTIDSTIYVDPKGTVRRRRYLDDAYDHKLFETHSIAEPYGISADTEEQVLKRLKDSLEFYDAVIVSDYGLGFITESIREYLIRNARVLCLYSQTNSLNNGFNPVTKYAKADYVCLDIPELRLATGRQHDPPEVLAEDVANRMLAKNIIVTLGHRGSLVRESPGKFVTIPAFSTKVVDTTGADDAYFAITSLLVASGAPPAVVGFVGNVVGALSVSILGSQKNIEPLSVRKFVKTLLR